MSLITLGFQSVLHGADDLYVPQTDVQRWVSAMQEAKVEDWTLIQLSNTVHSFTDPSAQSAGAHYNKRSAERAFQIMQTYADAWLEAID